MVNELSLLLSWSIVSWNCILSFSSDVISFISITDLAFWILFVVSIDSWLFIANSFLPAMVWLTWFFPYFQDMYSYLTVYDVMFHWELKHWFFSTWFSFTNILDSQDSRERGNFNFFNFSLSLPPALQTFRH